ncbi:hypothetical protein ABZ330_13580 [Streptomyces sp. NPDC006172]|uniref:Rv1733c family protein n=1 Tax=Streptomyces sp. NPDC006172 TaxID=3154470 RepID=UPI0033E31236
MRIRVRRRRRKNPLRRRCDVVEAWTVLAVAVLLLVAAPLAGALVGRWAYDDARAVAAEQRAGRHLVRAQVVSRPPETLPTAEGVREEAYRVTVRWTEPGGVVRTAPARVPSGTERGDTVGVWFDARGRAVPAPPDGAAVWQDTLTAGLGTAGGAGAAVLLGYAVFRRVTRRRRLDEWGREWARTGPEWSGRRA